MRAGARPRRLNAPSWGVRGFDYASIVQPVLDRRCVSCHSGPTPAGKVDLRGDKTDFFNASYEALARGRDHGGLVNSPYVNWIPTYNGWEQNILQIAPKAWGSPKSRLADIIVSGHPDAQGRARVRLTDDERLRVLLWIDLNVPYYGTALTAYPDNEGCRRLYPADLDATLADIERRRCVACHRQGVPRKPWVRIESPERNGFLLAPLARSSGGSEACGEPVFRDTGDPDYARLIATFRPVVEQLRMKPRMDMPGAKPAEVPCDRR